MEALDLAELSPSAAPADTQELVEDAPALVEGLDKPFDDYTTSEMLLFFLVFTLVISLLGDYLRRCTSWL